MEPYRPLRLGLFMYECLRLLFLVAVFSALRPGGGEGGVGFPWLVYAAPNALFPLMALFLWLNLARYGAYLPLFLAGKIIGLFSILGWLFFLQRSVRLGEFAGAAAVWIMPEIPVGILLCGDILAAAAVYFIIKKISITKTIQETTPDTPAQGGE